MTGAGTQRLVVIGGGFGGLEAVRKLRHAPRGRGTRLITTQANAAPPDEE
jgi:NADH dehydrogenase FAD-containing subunit